MAVFLKGFSLIELMTILAVMGVLASMSVPSYQSMLQQDRRKLAQQQLMSCASSLIKFRIKYGSFEMLDENMGVAGVCEVEVPIRNSKPHYSISLVANASVNNFTLIAEALSHSAKEDGDLTLSSSGLGCRVSKSDSCDPW